VVVLGVIPGTPADQAGIRPFSPATGQPGDAIVGLNGKPVEVLADLVAALDEAGVGEEVVLRVRRGKTERDVAIRVVDLQD